MPAYEYRCDACGADFTEFHTMTQHENAKVACPKCKSEQVSRVYGSVSVKTSRKS
jgi:putative FmdB family regulatory protein